MPVIPLPDEPNFEQLRKQAKDLRRAVLAHDPGALAEVAEYVPDAAGEVPLRTAQLVVARRYGFASWARLKRHVEVVERYSRFPDRMTAEPPASLADEFLRLVTAYYADQPERWAEGRRLLAEHPEITAGSVQAAAAAADTTALRRILAADPGAARREGGPFRWPPLFYLAYSRHDPQVAEAAVLIVSELVTNAIVHSGSEAVSCVLRLGSGLLRIEVTDQGVGVAEPAVRKPADDDVSGRGLLLVSAVSEAWGVSPALPGGRTVWATVRAVLAPRTRPRSRSGS